MNAFLKTTVCLLTVLPCSGRLLHAADPELNVVDQAPALELAPRLADPFGDNAIFQQNKPVPVWGWSLPGAEVLVVFEQQKKSAVAGKDGRWSVTLDAMPADKLTSVHEAPVGHTLTLLAKQEGKEATQSLRNILIGEVWLCSGQSNMAGPLRMDPYPEGTLAQANYPSLRKQAGREWILSSPETAGNFSRVAFCFGRKLQQELMIPIGLMIAATAGSPIESWMRILPEGLPIPQGKKDAVAVPPRGGNYETLIAPRVGFAMRGVLWYQGEANDKEGHEYFLKMQSMIGDWRRSWGQGDFPFYYVQLASIGTSVVDKPEGGDGRAKIRHAQLEALTLKNTGMAVAVDIGAPKEHPRNKYDVGIRLARWALSKDYDRKDIVPGGPLYKGFAIEGSQIRVTFDHAQNGLMVAQKKGYESPVPTPGAKIPWLSIQAKEGTWHWAEGKIEGTDLVVWSKDVADPVAVRYAYTQNPEGFNLYNTDGLPTSPFSSCGY